MRGGGKASAFVIMLDRQGAPHTGHSEEEEKNLFVTIPFFFGCILSLSLLPHTIINHYPPESDTLIGTQPC